MRQAYDYWQDQPGSFCNFSTLSNTPKCIWDCIEIRDISTTIFPLQPKHLFQNNSTNFALKQLIDRFAIVKSKEKRLSWKRWNKVSTHQYMESNIHLITGLYGIKRINQKDFVLELLFRTRDSSEKNNNLTKDKPEIAILLLDSTQLMWRSIHLRLNLYPTLQTMFLNVPFQNPVK